MKMNNNLSTLFYLLHGKIHPSIDTYILVFSKTNQNCSSTIKIFKYDYVHISVFKLIKYDHKLLPYVRC